LGDLDTTASEDPAVPSSGMYLPCPLKLR
jgi:hypothetical protein